MPIYHQGREVKEVYHQGRKVKEVWYMGGKIYSSFRTVTVKMVPGGVFYTRKWDEESVVGDRSLIYYFGRDEIRLSADVIYTRTDGGTGGLTASGESVSEGKPIPKGATLSGSFGTYQFTELKP